MAATEIKHPVIKNLMSNKLPRVNSDTNPLADPEIHVAAKFVQVPQFRRNSPKQIRILRLLC